MRIPSPDELLRGASGVLRRFPVVVTAALIAGIGAAVLVGESESQLALRALMGAQLGIPILLALRLYSERRGRLRLALTLGGGLLLLVYALSLSYPLLRSMEIRFVQLNVAAHLLVAFLPWLGRREADGFWQYNKTLFLRILNSLLFTGVLIIGLNVAMLALDRLFGLKIEGRYYGRLDLLLLFIFNTWYFLAGIPRDYAALDSRRDTARGIKVFAQYILAPLVAVYLALLIAYLLKVLISAVWPSGWIGWLVSSVAAAGLLSLALLHPLLRRGSDRWVAVYARAFYVLMLPAVGMQLMALAKRIGQYGFTEPRYFLLLLALWMLVISVVGALNRLKRLETLPATLCLIALCSAFGPWGAYAVSRSSQMERLESLLSEAGALRGGKLAPVTQAPSLRTRREISSVLDYIVVDQGHAPLMRWLDAEQSAQFADSAATKRRYERRLLSRLYMDYAGIAYQADWRAAGKRRWLSASRERGAELIELQDYRYALQVTLNGEQAQTCSLSGRELSIAQAANQLVIKEGRDSLLILPLASLIERLAKRLEQTGGEAVGPDLLKVASASETLRACLHAESLQWQEADAGPRLQRITGLLLIEPLDSWSAGAAAPPSVRDPESP